MRGRVLWFIFTLCCLLVPCLTYQPWRCRPKISSEMSVNFLQTTRLHIPGDSVCLRTVCQVPRLNEWRFSSFQISRRLCIQSFFVGLLSHSS
jgi:hypothetical protein